jgi:molybdopterin-guanine dinucleotide biosynthesis protein MobB
MSNCGGQGVETTKTVFVVGTKNSGKTAVAEYLVKRLTEMGFRVGAIKHIHHEFTIDSEGKDTYRMRKAGASLVVSFSPSEIALLRPPGNPKEEFDELSRNMARDGFDFLVVEGFKAMSQDLPSTSRILTCKTTAELDSILHDVGGYDCISGIVSTIIEGDRYHAIPVIRFPERAEDLIRMIAGKQMKRV